MTLTSRLATKDDFDIIRELIEVSMQGLLPLFLDSVQVQRSYDSMGLDTGLVEDGTYFLVFDGEDLVGCGGWSRRRTLFGGDHKADRDDSLANPETEPAKIRAMYAHPDHTRKGIGRLLLSLAENAAYKEGFRTFELGATAPGVPFYRQCGYDMIKDVSARYSDGVIVPIHLMRKIIV